MAEFHVALALPRWRLWSVRWLAFPFASALASVGLKRAALWLAYRARDWAISGLRVVQ